MGIQVLFVKVYKINKVESCWLREIQKCLGATWEITIVSRKGIEFSGNHLSIISPKSVWGQVDNNK